MDLSADRVTEAVLSAGRFLLDCFGKVHEIRYKGAIDIVTEADLAVQNFIIDQLKTITPGFSILSEEGYKNETSSSSRWILDPLDGTVNFAHGFPFFAISLALEVENAITHGWIYNPVYEELFFAHKGRGAFKNGKRIEVSSSRDLLQSLIATGFPYHVHKEAEKIARPFTAFLGKARGIRRAGSAALDLAYLACGVFDGFWEEGLKPWDVAAGWLLVEEAAGKVSTFDGSPYCLEEATILASNGYIHEAMIEVLRPVTSF